MKLFLLTAVSTFIGYLVTLGLIQSFDFMKVRMNTAVEITIVVGGGIVVAGIFAAFVGPYFL